jgi:hypothetical protein
MPQKPPEKLTAEEHLRSLNAAWTNALTCPLPPSISYKLLDTLRAHVLAYLDFVTRDLVQDDPAMALAEIQRAADRLTRIAAIGQRKQRRAAKT